MAKQIYSIADIKNKLVTLLADGPVKKAVLFGSYAKGNADEKSDIDLLIDSNGELNAINFYGVVGQIADAFDVSVDVIERMEVEEDSPVDREIKQTGVVVYDSQITASA